MADVAVPAVSTATGWEGFRRDADRYFRWSVALTGAITAAWLFFVLTGRDGGFLFKGYQLSLEAVGRVAVGFMIMTVVWGWLWNEESPRQRAMTRALARQWASTPWTGLIWPMDQRDRVRCPVRVKRSVGELPPPSGRPRQGPRVGRLTG